MLACTRTYQPYEWSKITTVLYAASSYSNHFIISDAASVDSDLILKGLTVTTDLTIIRFEQEFNCVCKLRSILNRQDCGDLIRLKCLSHVGMFAWKPRSSSLSLVRMSNGVNWTLVALAALTIPSTYV